MKYVCKRCGQTILIPVDELKRVGMRRVDAHMMVHEREDAKHGSGDVQQDTKKEG